MTWQTVGVVLCILYLHLSNYISYTELSTKWSNAFLNLSSLPWINKNKCVLLNLSSFPWVNRSNIIRLFEVFCVSSRSRWSYLYIADNFMQSKVLIYVKILPTFRNFQEHLPLSACPNVGFNHIFQELAQIAS